MSTTYDAAAQPGRRTLPGGWPRVAMAAAAAASLGFVVGFGLAKHRSAPSPAATLAGLAVSEASLAGAAAELAIRVERLADAERSVIAHRGRLAEAEQLMRAGVLLRDAMLAGGPYAVPLAAAFAVPGAETALAPLRASLLAGSTGVPDRAGLAAELDAIATSVLALGEEEPASWLHSGWYWLGGLLRADSRAAIQARRREAFAAASEAAGRGALVEAIVALDTLDADAATALSGWIDAARRRMAQDAMADRAAAAVAAFAYR